jgi:hypothetical protein
MGSSIRVALVLLVVALLCQCSDNPTKPNHAPILAPIAPQSVQEGERLEFLVLATDQDGTIPALSARNVPTNASAVDSGNGTMLFIFEPDFTQSGIYDVTFIAFDGRLADSQVVMITVTPYSVGELWPMAVGNYWVYETTNYETNIYDTTKWWDLRDSTHVRIDSVHVQSGSQSNGVGQWFLSDGGCVTVRNGSITYGRDIAVPLVWPDRAEIVPAGIFNQTYRDCTLHGLLPSFTACLVFAKGVGIIRKYSCTVWSSDASCTVSRLVRYYVK